MAVFTYGLQVAQEQFAENQLDLLSLSDLPSLLKIGVEDGLISSEEQQLVEDWASDPVTWRARA